MEWLKILTAPLLTALTTIIGLTIALRLSRGRSIDISPKRIHIGGGSSGIIRIKRDDMFTRLEGIKTMGKDILFETVKEKKAQQVAVERKLSIMFTAINEVHTTIYQDNEEDALPECVDMAEIEQVLSKVHLSLLEICYSLLRSNGFVGKIKKLDNAEEQQREDARELSEWNRKRKENIDFLLSKFTEFFSDYYSRQKNSYREYKKTLFYDKTIKEFCENISDLLDQVREISKQAIDCIEEKNYNIYQLEVGLYQEGENEDIDN